MAWDKRKRDDCQDELFAENARIERERKQGAIDDAQAMADASGTPEEELEVPKDTWGTVRRLWGAAAGERWRFGVVIVAILVYTGFHVAAPAYSARVIDVLWTNIQEAFAAGRAFTVGWETGGRELAVLRAVLCHGGFRREIESLSAPQHGRQAQSPAAEVLRRP